MAPASCPWRLVKVSPIWLAAARRGRRRERCPTDRKEAVVCSERAGVPLYVLDVPHHRLCPTDVAALATIHIGRGAL
jgi:hypothetical protein